MHFTQNPIGSDDQLDLQDNAIALDYAMNSPAALWQDRFGKQHKTVQQALKDVGFKPTGFDFVSGGTLGIGDRDKCVFYPTDGYWYSWNGKLPYVVPANSSPTPGGKKGWGIVTRDERVVAREALRRTYQEVGLNLVEGSFEEGAVLVNVNDVLLQQRTGKAFSGPAGAVSAGTDPASGGFVDRSVLTAVKRRTLSWFGAREGENSTSAILAAATSGLDIVVDVNTKIVDQSITLSSGQSWVDGGGSIRQECALLNPQPTNPNSPYGVSSTPLFKLSSAGSCVDGVTMYPAFEAVQMSAASKFKNNKCYGEGRTWYDGVNAFASSCEVFGNEIVDFGQWLPGITYAQRGDGIFFSNSASFNRYCTARDNVVRGCAKNGVLAIGCKMVRITDNVLIGNRMSAIQIAFLSSLGSDNASGIIVKGNLGEYNGADSFDCNNKTSNPPENTSVNAIVTNNVFRSNGWIYPTREEQLSRTGTKQETPDGGACTLINVSRVSYIDNDIYDNARACAYINNSPECIVSDNRYYKETSATGDDTDGFRVANSKSCIIERNFARVPRVAYRFDGNCSGTIIAGNNTKTTVSGADAIVTPNGAIIGEFSDNVVEIVNGNWFTNGIITPKRCKFVATVAGSTIFRLPDDSDFDGNEFTFPQGNLTFDGLVRLGINGLKVSASTASASGSVRVRNLSGICRFKDVKINQGGSTAALLLDGGSFTLYIRDGRIAHTASGNNIRVISGSSAMVIRTDGVDLSTGFSDFTGAARQQLTWA